MRQPNAKHLGAAMLLTAVLAALSSGQTQRTLPGQRSFDRNTSLLDGASNDFYGPGSPLLGGNALASGNVGRGLSLRSFSTIRDPNALRTTLGSGSLSNFLRDSVSAADSYSRYGGLAPRLYFDPSQTAFSRQLYESQRSTLIADRTAAAPTTGQPAANVPQPLDQRLESRIDSGARLRDQILGVAPRAPDNSQSLITEPPTAGSTLRGGQADALQAQSSVPQVSGPIDTRITPTLPPAINMNQPLEAAAAEARGAYDLVLSGAAGGSLLDRRLNRLTEEDKSEKLGFRSIDRRASPEQPAAAETAAAAPSELPVAPGLDVFVDLQIAAALARDPGAKWFDQMKSASMRNPTLAGQRNEIAQLSAESFRAKVMDAPIQTFVGKGADATNDSLGKAEALMHSGKYLDAAQQYEHARVFDPNNPLPLLGKANASLAAGDYRTAAYNLVAGLQRFPEFSRFRFDLAAFMGGETIDLRRADLMKLLNTREDATLRFLLGYLEYHSGQPERGLDNLRKAAEEAAPDSFMAKFPAMIRREATLPPPKLPPAPEGGSGVESPRRP
ncbi:MAG: hypothetical protein CHACPFDD_01580 [Phycisphaerae bacterium]|nr:hypothetical protein [Phycisphaerae bacterium]